MRVLYVFFTLTLFALFVGCGGGGGGGGGSKDNPVDVVLVDGYIKDATMKDGDNTPVKYQSDTKTYHFYDTPKQYIKVSGGKFEGSNLENKMTYNVPPETKVISPVVHFLHQYPQLTKSLSKSLRVSEDSLKQDFIKHNKLEIAKLAQIIYAMEIHGLSRYFASSLSNITSLSDITLRAIEASSGHSKETAIRNFLLALNDKTDVSTLENELYEKKRILQESVPITPPPNGEQPNPNPSLDSLKVMGVTPKGNLKLEVDFSENVNINTQAHKDAFVLQQLTTSDVHPDANQTLTLNTSSVIIPLKNAIETENKNNTYVVTVSDSFLSKEGLSLNQKSTTVSVAPTQFVLEKVVYIDAKTIQATFNLPIDSSTITTADFVVKGASVSYGASYVKLDPENDKSLIITLGNTLTSQAGYELRIKNDSLKSQNSALSLAEIATKEFVATPSTTNLQEGFNLVNASVDATQENIILNFSKNIMDLPRPDMFDIKLKALGEPLDINVSEINGTSRTATIKPSEVLLSPENNNTSYQLSIAKQTIFSTDGARTFGLTYKKVFEITDYPKVTNATLSGSRINISFNKSMDLNQSFVSVAQNGSETNVNFSGSGANYTLSDANGTDFNASGTTLTIQKGVISSDQKSVLDSDYVKDFNGTN